MEGRRKVDGFRGVYEEVVNGRRVFVPVLKVFGEQLDLGSHPTAQDAAMAYDICKLHAALFHGRDEDKLEEEVKLNNSVDMYLHNVAFINLRENASVQECAELIKSGVILDQFQTRFRPVLRATSTHRAGPPPPQPQPPKREPHRDTSPPAQPQRDHHHPHTHHHPQQQQQSQQHSLGRSQSMPAEKQQRDKERGGGGERPAEKSAGEKLARQPSAAAPAAPPPSPPQSKATSAGGGGAGGGTAAEEDDKKKRKARWVLYEGMYTVWISERTASGNSLSIPAFVKDKVFTGVEDGDAITATNARSKKVYEWKYRNMRKEADSVDKHYLMNLKPFVLECYLSCGDVLQVKAAGDRAVEFVIHRASTPFVADFLKYLDTKPPGDPKPRGGGGGGSSAAAEGAGRQQQSQQQPQKGEGPAGKAAARKASIPRPQQLQQEEEAGGRGEEGQEVHQKPPSHPATQHPQQQPAAGKPPKQPAAAPRPKSSQGSPAPQQPSPFASSGGGQAQAQGGGEEGSKPRKKAARSWAEYPAGSGQFVVGVSESMARSGKMTVPAVAWTALISNQRPQHADTVKAINAGGDGTHPGYPLTSQPMAEGGGGGLLSGLGTLFRSSSVAAGDVLALRPDGLTNDGRAVVRFHVWKESSEEVAKFRKQLEQLRRGKSLPVGGGGSGPDKVGAQGGLPRSASSIPSPTGQKLGKRAAPAEAPQAVAAPKAPRQPAGKQQAHPPRRQQVVEDSSSSEDAAPVRAPGHAAGTGAELGSSEDEGSTRQLPRQPSRPSVPHHSTDASPKRKASGDAGEPPAAKRPVAAVTAKSVTPAGRPEASVGRSQGTGGHKAQRPAEEGAAHSGRAKRPAASDSHGGVQQQQYQRQQQPAAEQAPSEAVDLSRLPPKKRMMMQAQARAQASAVPTASGAQSVGASAYPEARRGGGEEGPCDSQGDSSRRRGAGPDGSLAGRQRPEGGAGRGALEDEVSPGAAASIRVRARPADPLAPDEHALLTPTSPPLPPHAHDHHQQQLWAPQQGGAEGEAEAQEQQSAGRGVAARHVSPPEHSSGTAGDRPQLQNTGSFTALVPAGGSREPSRLGGQRPPPAPGQQQHHHQQAARAAQQQECSAAPAGGPQGSAAMGSAAQDLGPPLRDSHEVANDEVAVVHEAMRLVDLTVGAGKVTLELAADIKMGLMGMSPLNRWVLYSTVKPLFDVGSWDKLVECLRKVVPMG